MGPPRLGGARQPFGSWGLAAVVGLCRAASRVGPCRSGVTRWLSSWHSGCGPADPGVGPRGSGTCTERPPLAGAPLTPRSQDLVRGRRCVQMLLVLTQEGGRGRCCASTRMAVVVGG